MVGDTTLPMVTKATILVVWAPAAFVKATILTIHHQWVTIWQYGGRRDQSSGARRSHYFSSSAIEPPLQAAPLAEPSVLVVYLKYKFKLKKYGH